MQIAIGVATDTQYEVGAINEKATLSAELADGAFVAGQPGSLVLVITNGGPQPAYRVTAKLQSSVAALHGYQLSFGRIDPGKTKIRKQAVSLPSGLNDRSTVVVAQISYFNGDHLEARKRFDLKPDPKGNERPPGTATVGSQASAPRGLAVECKPVAAEVAPGERVRIDCELRNLGSEPLAQVALKVAVGGVDQGNQVPKSLPGAASVKLELVGVVSPSAKPGTRLPVIIRATARGVSRVEQSMSVAVASPSTGCKARLTRSEYQVKHKRLQAALDAGALTQKEFDAYDADLVSCLQ
jgi:hypothetical protein